MRFCVFGVGAVGGLLLARLNRAGLDVCGVARGETLAALKARGIRVQAEGAELELSGPLTVSDDPAALGPQDVVVIAMKAHALARALPDILPLIGPETTVVPAVNGIPWWYFHGLPGTWPQTHLETVDPGGRIWQALGPERVLGCVVYLAAWVLRPGMIHCTPHDLITLGEPDGSMSPRLAAVADALTTAGFRGRAVADIRDSIWHKVWGNAWANSISVITGATLEQICSHSTLHAPLRQMMEEVRDVAAAYGVTLNGDIDERIEQSAALGAFRSSTLQDFERGRPIELDAILGSLSEMGRLAGVATPGIDMVYGLTQLTAQIAGCYSAASA